MTLTECTKIAKMKSAAFRKADFNEIRELFKWFVLEEGIKEISNLQEYQGHRAEKP